LTLRIGQRAALALMVAVGLMGALPAQALQCVPYARAASGIDLRGDAWRWWNAAAGVYDRGHAPKLGAVMVFRKYGKMRLGHVAVVQHVVNGREILIDHANWGPRGAKGRVMKMVSVRDVSPHNDWSQVKVWNVNTEDYGTRTYPTYGFIYPRGGAKVSEAVFTVEMPEDVTSLLASAEQNPPTKVDMAATEAVLDTLASAVPQPVAEELVKVDYNDESAAPVAEQPAAPAPIVLAEVVHATPVSGRLKRPWDGDHQAAVLAGSGKY
jgi:surface antigen